MNFGLPFTTPMTSSTAVQSLRSILWLSCGNRVQLTTDGHHAYLEAVEGAFGSDID